MHKQAGGTALGLVLGILIGLAGALAVAVYVTKVPVPFVDRGVSGTPGQDAEEAKKNQNWDPNGLLGGVSKPSNMVPLEPVAVPQTFGDGDSPLEAPAVSSDPLGDLARAKMAGDDVSVSSRVESTATPKAPVAAAVMGTDTKMNFYVQAGAFATVDEAESQRARLAIMGVDVRVSTTVLDGKTLHRVRSGPYRDRDDANGVRERLKQAGVTSSLVAIRRL
jgi:cell division protein FtsN|tara:strand:+ start:313 stop:975 length:663 start_codon:yes stop_codon:yes gene_type:complete